MKLGWCLSRAREEQTPKRVTQPLPVSQTLTSCQMLPVTVTGSAFDRKIVSVLPVSFCLSFIRARQKNEPQETKYCMPNLLYTCNVRRGMQYWFLRVHSFLFHVILRARQHVHTVGSQESFGLTVTNASCPVNPAVRTCNTWVPGHTTSVPQVQIEVVYEKVG